MPIKDVVNRFFPSSKKIVEGRYVENPAITLTPVTRKRAMTEDERRAYATELLDTYWGFSGDYLAKYIEATISNNNIRKEMLKIVRSLPLLQFFTNSISRVYGTQPVRRFYLDGKEIIKPPVEKTNKSGDAKESETFDKSLNEDKFLHDAELFDTLSNLYSDDILNSIKQSERFTNLLHTTVYKVITNDLGQVRMTFLPNDTVQVESVKSDLSRAEQIAFVQDTVNSIENNTVLIPIIENWSEDTKEIPLTAADKERLDLDEEDNINQAAVEYEKLFDTKQAGSAFAPFVVFRDIGDVSDFWDQKDKDIVDYIKSINMSLTELKYLEKFTSFGLKYTVNIKEPVDRVMDPNGMISFAVENSAVPGVDNNKNFEIGEFKNAGNIDDVIKSIIFNMKMLFSIHHIPLDALISSNSVRSAENKQMDNDELFNVINGQRDIWNKNEQVLFGVLQAVHNRDNDNKIPKGVELLVDYKESNSVDKVAEDWLVEIQNNISTALDWLAADNPDLDRDELMELLSSNKEINDKQKGQPLNLSEFAQSEEDPEDLEEEAEDININENNNDDDNNTDN